MKKTTYVLIGIVILAFGFFLLLNNAPDKNSSAIESVPSEREVSPDKLSMKYKSASKPTSRDDSSTSEDESR